MDIAQCICDNRLYTAAQFADDPGLRARCHGALRCVGLLADRASVCDAEAYYSPGASNGTKAHFGARAHRDGCNRAARHAAGRPAPLEVEVQRIVTDNGRLRIDLGSGPAGEPEPADGPAADPDDARPVRRVHTGEPPRVRVPAVGLARLLEYLVHANLAATDVRLRIEREERPVREWVGDLGTAGDRVGQRRLFWGRVAGVARERGWVNVEGPNPAHIRVAGGLAGAIWTQLATPAARAVAPGTPAIVLGTVERKQQTYITVTNPN